MKKIYFLLINFIALCNNLSAQTYHEDDKEGLRKFLRQTEIDKEGNIVKNFQNLGLTTQDTLNWQTSEDWVSKVIGLTWDSAQFKRIKQISWSQKDLYGMLNCSLFEILTNLECDSNQLTSIDVSKNVNLRWFNCSKNQLTSIDISNNVNLEWLFCSSNQLTNIELSKNVNLEYLECDFNQLSSIDVSKNVDLKQLFCSSNQLSSIDVTNNKNLNRFVCGTNHLTSIDLSNNMNLSTFDCSNNQLTNLEKLNNMDFKALNCQSNYLKFSSLPLLTVEYYDYFPQKKLKGGEFYAGQLIDLSSEYTIDGNITTYSWYNIKGESISLSSAGNGIFTVPDEYIGETLLCKMANTRFPKLTIEYEVYIKEQNLPVVQDHLQIKTSKANKHEVSKGEIFKVYAVLTSPEKIRIGLFSNVDNTSLISRVDISRKDNTYTCTIPQDVRAVSYVIQPYIENNGAIEIVERPEKSILIDKLPLAVKQEDIWGYSIFSNDVFKNLQIKTTDKNLYQVEVKERFQVNVPTGKEVKIGLFDINGIFVEDVTVSKTKNTYTCTVFSDVDEGNYIIAPYEVVNGKVKMQERIKDTHWIDRLPLYIVNDIWGYSLTKKAKVQTSKTSVKIYPNPVKETLSVNTEEKVNSFEVYNLMGEMIKKGKNSATINVQNLNKGIYVLKISTDKGTSTYKFSKE